MTDSIVIFDDPYLLQSNLLERIHHVDAVLDQLGHGHFIAVKNASNVLLLARAVRI